MTHRHRHESDGELRLLAPLLWAVPALVYFTGAYSFEDGLIRIPLLGERSDLQSWLADVAYGPVSEMSLRARIGLGAVSVAGAIVAALAAARNTVTAHWAAAGVGVDLLLAALVTTSPGKPAWIGLVLAGVSAWAGIRRRNPPPAPGGDRRRSVSPIVEEAPRRRAPGGRRRTSRARK